MYGKLGFSQGRVPLLVVRSGPSIRCITVLSLLVRAHLIIVARDEGPTLRGQTLVLLTGCTRLPVVWTVPHLTLMTIGGSRWLW